IKQETHGIMNLSLLDQMIIIQHQKTVSGKWYQIIEQSRQNRREWGSLPSLQQDERLLSNAGQRVAQGCDDHMPKPERVIVQGIQREPGHHQFGIAPCAPEPSFSPDLR